MAHLWQLPDQSLHPEVESFLSSLATDQRLLPEELQASRAHCQMLAKCGILNQPDADLLLGHLRQLEEEHTTGTLRIDPMAEDIHSFVEQELDRRSGGLGAAIHAGRSRNDQVATDLRLYLVRHCRLACAEIAAAIAALVELAGEHVDTLMPGYTHTRKAQPISLAFHLLAWCAALERDWSRFEAARARSDECPLGSAALCGTGLPIDREATAASLGFARPSRNALDASSDRDGLIDYAAAAASLAMHLSRFCEEIIQWTGEAQRFASLSADSRTGSSIMPQKQNPDLAELLRGRSGLAFGTLIGLLTLQKSLPYGYNRDLQEDKNLFFPLSDQVQANLRAFRRLVLSLRPDPHTMRQALLSDYLEATDLAELLVLRGIPFRQAYRIAKTTVQEAARKHKRIQDLTQAELDAVAKEYTTTGIKSEDLKVWLKPEACVGRRCHTGGTAPEAVLLELARLKAWCTKVL